MTTDHVDRTASVIWATSRRDEGTISAAGANIVARALDAAGLLVKYPRLEIEGDWLIEVVDYHTCGAGPGSGAGHEPGCGSIPVARLATPEHDRQVIEKFLREQHAPKIRIENPEFIIPFLAKAWDEGCAAGATSEWAVDDDEIYPPNPYRKGETDDRR